MLHFVTSYMKQSKSRKQTLESAQYGLEIIFKGSIDGIKCSSSQNWPKQVFEVHLNCLTNSTN